MFTFLLQLRETLQHGHPLHLFTIFVATVWVLWAVKVLLSRRYRPWTAPYRPTTSVVVPVVDEPPDLFREVLRRIAAQEPDETIVVINGPRNPALEAICNQCPGELTWTWTPVAGKRNAIRAGVEGTIRQGVAVTGMRRARYRGLPKTRLEHVYSAVALNLIRLDAYWNGNALDRTRTSHLARLDLALPA